MVVVMAFGAVIFTKCVEHRIIIGGNCVNDPFFYKGLKRAVDGYPVKLRPCLLLDIAVCKSSGLQKEEAEDLLPAACHAEVIALQYVPYLILH